MKVGYTDQMKRELSIDHPPKRIISLVPSQTELLFALGLEDEVVGITKFCIHPEEQFKKKLRIGGTKVLDMERIRELQPDLIIGNKEENEQDQIEALAADYPVWMSDIENLKGAIEMIGEIGHIVGRSEQAEQLIAQIKQGFGELQRHSQNRPTKRAAYFIWRNPHMVAASGTFIHEMMGYVGFENVFAWKQRYPVVSMKRLAAAQPEVILLSSEPYPFKAAHLEEFQQFCPQSVVKLVDGEFFSWYGSRLQHAVPYFLKLQEELG